MGSKTNKTQGPGPPDLSDGVHSKYCVQFLPEELINLFSHNGVTILMPDLRNYQFLAVPIGSDFNKARTNILVHQIRLPEHQWQSYVDDNLEYAGQNPPTRQIFTGRCIHGWRGLHPVSISYEPLEALLIALQLLGSPLTKSIQSWLVSTRAQGTTRAELAGSQLSSWGQWITPEQCTRAFERTRDKKLSEQLALAVNIPDKPQCALIWGNPGVGKDLLMLSTVYFLKRQHQNHRILCVSGHTLALGCIFPPEIDAALDQLLSLIQAEDCWLLLKDIDICFTGTSTSAARLCSAIDNGVRFLATVQDLRHINRFKQNQALKHRILAIQVQPPSNEQLKDILLQTVKQNKQVIIQPSAIKSIIGLSQTNDEVANEPSTSLALLHRAIQWAAYKNIQVDPDLVCSLLQNQWPEIN